MSLRTKQRPLSEDGSWRQPSVRSTQASCDEPNALRLRSGDLEADLSVGLVEQSTNARPKCFRNLLEEVIFISTVMMAVSCTTFIQGVTIINTATIGRSLHMTPAEITWITAAIGLGSGSFMLMFGKTADLFGCRPQLLVGMIWLASWSLGTAFVPDAVALDIFCAMLGIGTALISPPAIGAMFATYPEGRRRNLATGALGSANPIGFILGSMSSGVMTKYFDWQASFIFLAIFFFVALLLAIYTMPSIPRQGDVKDNVKHFDYLGTVLNILGIGLVSFALTEGPQTGWNSASFIASLLSGLACVFGFVVWEKLCTYPLLDPAIWKNKNFTLCVLTVMFGYGSFATSQFWISLYLQKIQRLSGIQIAVQLMTQAISGIGWSYLGQYLVSRVNGTILMGIGGLAYFTGTLLLTFVNEDTSYWRLLFPSLIITVIGADFQFIVSNLFVNKHMSDQASLGAGVLQTAMRLSIALGLAISTAVFGAVQNHHPSNTMLTDPRNSLPYHRALLSASIFAAVGLLFIPFIRINTKDVPPDPMQPSLPAPAPVDERHSLGSDAEKSSGCNSLSHVPNSDPSHHGETSEYPFYSSANASFQSAISYLSGISEKSEVSLFSKWSWEASPGKEVATSVVDECYAEATFDGRVWPEMYDGHQQQRQRFHESQRLKRKRPSRVMPFEEEKKVLYEVCVNCLQERRVLIEAHGYGLGRGDGSGGDAEAQRTSKRLSDWTLDL